MAKHGFMNDWSHTATLQLLENWRRCGVGKIPKSSAEGVANASRWLEQLRLDAGVESADSMGLITSTNQSISSTEVVSSAQQPVPKTSSRETQSVLGEVPSKPRDAESLGTASPAIPTVSTTPAAPVSPVIVASSDGGKWSESPLDIVSRENRFKILSQDAAACRKCTDIVCRRKQAVFGTGPVNARLVMFGEAPGADEDRIGQPFVGAAGQLMDKILVASGLRREDVYIMNSLKCRPPDNRTPTETEVESCRPFFETQLETIQPEYIICWGAVAVRAVLKTTESVGRLRGRFHPYKGAKVLVTYHPSYLLRNPDAKRLTWEDMKFLMRELGIPLPAPKKP
ncbi:MAG: uracil-DNA glycosylase family protein [Pirellula sp.]